MDDGDPPKDLEGEEQQGIRAALIDEEAIGSRAQRPHDRLIEGGRGRKPVRAAEPLYVHGRW